MHKSHKLSIWQRERVSCGIYGLYRMQQRRLDCLEVFRTGYERYVKS